MAVLGKITAFIALFCVSVAVGVFGAYVLTDLWRWFVVPLGVQPLVIWQAMGLLVIVGLLKMKRNDTTKDENAGPLKILWSGSVYWFVAYLISWGFGAIYHAAQVHWA